MKVVDRTGTEDAQQADGHATGEAAAPIAEESDARYRRLWRSTVALTAFVSLAPLAVMAVLNYLLYQQVVAAEVARPATGEASAGWHAQRWELVGFLGTSVVLILAVVFWNASAMVKRLRAVDQKRAQVLHNLEFTNKMATIGRLAASVAHELANPLAVINENAGLAADIVSTSTEMPHQSELTKAIGAIQKSVARGTAISRRLLGFARRMDVKIEVIDIAELLREVLSFLGKQTQHRNIVVELHVAEGVPTVQADRVQLQQVFLNLISNAVAAVADGGRIDIGVAALDAERVAVEVKDDGRGISAADLPNVFEPFFSTKGEQGTGLGLSVVRDIVGKLGGTITVDSTLGKGAAFTVTLPLPKPTF